MELGSRLALSRTSCIVSNVCQIEARWNAKGTPRSPPGPPGKRDGGREGGKEGEGGKGQRNRTTQCPLTWQAKTSLKQEGLGRTWKNERVLG